MRLMRLSPLLQTLLLTSILFVVAYSSNTNVPKDIINVLLDSKLYDFHATPTQNEDYPTNVTISMYIEGLSSFQASTMDFHADIYFQERWVDRRLKHNSTNRILVKDQKIFDLMWHPDLYFANARSSEFHSVTAPNFFLWIYPNGTVYYDTRISLTVMCMMDLFTYPLDKQECDIRILSYAYDEEQLVIRWLEGNPIDRNMIKLADMELTGVTTGTCNGNYAIGNWSCVTSTFHVRREIMHHILQSYIPSALIVVISWFSFWLDVDSVPGRVSLCITTLLTLATQASATRLSLPQVSYIKAIDVWMGTCLAFVFGVMIEFTLVNYWSRRKPPFRKLIYMNNVEPPARRNTADLVLRKRIKNTTVAIKTDTMSVERAAPEIDPRLEHMDFMQIPRVTKWDKMCQQEAVDTVDTMAMQYKRKARQTAIIIDRWCRILFPFFFALFNMIYWPYYVYYERPKDNGN